MSFRRQFWINPILKKENQYQYRLYLGKCRKNAKTNHLIMAVDKESFGILIESIRRFISNRLVPIEDDVEQSNDVPSVIVDEMKEMGLFGLSIPEEFGGIGLSMSQEALVAFEFGQTSLAFRSVFGTNVGIGSQGILMDGTESQKSEILPLVAKGELILSFALTEPDTGSDAASLSTTAKKDGENYIINGTKRYITNAPRANAFTLMARTGGVGAAGISAFIVPSNAKGLSLGQIDKKMGQRGTKTCDVILDNVVVPAKNIIGGVPGVGFKTAMKVLNRGRIHIAALSCGVAKRILDESIKYSNERVQFGKKIGEFQLIQAMLADCYADLYAGWSMVKDCAAIYDQKQVGLSDSEIIMKASAAKLFCTEMVGRVADKGVQIHGGAGYISDYKVERFYRDVRLLRLYEGTSQIQQLIIAKELLR